MNNKRKMLKRIASVGAAVTIVPTSWIKPVINSVVLPAHAQTSVTPTIRASFERSSPFIAILDDEEADISSFNVTPDTLISTPFTSSVTVFYDPPLPDFNGVIPLADIKINILVDAPFNAVPSEIIYSGSNFNTTVNILDGQNAIVLTISVNIEFQE